MLNVHDVNFFFGGGGEAVTFDCTELQEWLLGKECSESPVKPNTYALSDHSFSVSIMGAKLLTLPESKKVNSDNKEV